MDTIRLNLKERTYNIILGTDILSKLGKYIKKLKIGKDAFIITNELLNNNYGTILKRTLEESGFSYEFKLVADSEKSKSIETAFSVIKDLAKFDKKKQIFIVALGGGVIGDLAGFVASIYRRGIPFVNIPTTLLAEVDSSIGGKTAVDLPQGKNLVGAFYQPKLVLSDTGLLKTLDKRQIRSGLAEVIKYGIIKDLILFEYLEKNYPDILKLRPECLEFIIKRCSLIKARIVELDEKEVKGTRTILNFGHTIGHAIETAGGYNRYNHGEAVALGMLVASEISEKLKLVSIKTVRRIENLINNVGLPTKIERLDPDKIINAHYHDKKFAGKINKFVLIKAIGKTIIVKNISLPTIKEAIKKRF